MRIVVDCLAATTGGGVTYLRSLLGAVLAADESIELVFVACSRDPLGDLSQHARVRIVCPIGEAPATPRKLAWQLGSLGLATGRLGGDVLFSPSELAPLRSTVPVVLGFQNPNLYDQPVRHESRYQQLRLRLLLAGARVSARRASAAVFVSEPFRRAVAERIPLDGVRQYVIEPGLDPIFTGARDTGEGFEELQPYVLSVSDVYAYKNYPLLVDAFAALARDDLRLVIAGLPFDRYAQRETEQRARANGIEDQVVMLGSVPRERMPGLYTRAECFVFPSLLESFGFPPLEAMACGLPVACARASVMPDLLGDAAEWFDGRDPTSCATALGVVLDDRDRRAALVAKGKSLVSRFDWSRAGAALVRVFDSVSRSERCPDAGGIEG
ncbi:MAG TPA: glycosyltransferase family 1 protein [Gaiellaceae bacterium]|nr:glycosyltransferase family 1 protein [Gaiellaceae bacterium]